jgi:pyruvate/2-oxoglutarate dehydrogenase complex dihydrolipoamide dehydrogenase (E3) component
MIILGGGPIGVEMATAFNRLGTAVTLVEMAPSILFREDQELAGILAGRLVQEGVSLITGAKVIEASVQGGGVALTIQAKGAGPRLTAGALLVAAGRRPNTEGLDLEAAGVEFDAKGIRVDKYLRTTAKNIYAAGDATGPYQFSHVANYQAIIAVSNALLPLRRKAMYDHVPWCVFSDPELARSGLTEQEASEKHGGTIRVYRVPYSGIDRAVTDRAETGLAKFICGRRGRILGIHILGERAGEVMHEAHAAKALGIPLYRLDRVIHAYPCYNDVVKQAARSAYIDRVQGNPLVRLVKFFRRSK